MTTGQADPLANEPSRAGGHEKALHRIADLMIVVVMAAAILGVVWLLSDVLLLVFAATLVACQLRALALAISRWSRLPYGVALAVIVIGFGVLAATLSYLRGPAIVSEFRDVYNEIEARARVIWTGFGQSTWLQEGAERIQTYVDNRSGVLAGTAAGFVTATIGNLGSFLLIVVAAIYLAASPDLYVKGILSLMPKAWRRRGSRVLREEGQTLRRWFVGQLVDMLAIGVMTSFGLWALGVPLYPSLGMIAALANFVPYIGALAGSIPAIVVALGQSPLTALWVAVLFFGVQTIEGNLISPLISRRTVELPPVLTLFAQTILGSLFGPVGLILATPITAAASVLVRIVYVEGYLEGRQRNEARDDT